MDGLSFLFLSFFALISFYALLLELIVDVPLIFSCVADHVVQDWQFLGMVGARSVNVKKPKTHTQHVPGSCLHIKYGCDLCSWL